MRLVKVSVLLLIVNVVYAGSVIPPATPGLVRVPELSDCPTNKACVDPNGNVKIHGNVLPATADTQTLGSQVLPWDNLYFTDNIGDTTNLESTAILQKQLREESSLLPFTISNSVDSSELVQTLTDQSGLGIFAITINGKVLTSDGSTLVSDNLTPYAGTDADPKTIYTYLQNDGSDNIEFVGSNTDPHTLAINHIDIANIKAGAVSASSFTNYGQAAGAIVSANIADKIYHETFYRGSVYISGMGVTSTSSNVTIAAGEIFSILREVDTTQQIAGTDGQVYINSAGQFATDTTFTYSDEYADGTAIGVNKYFNVTLGITACNGASCIYAVVQRGDGTEYATVAGAISDGNNNIEYFPNDPLISKIYRPVCRIIVQNTGTGVLQQWPNGDYHQDLRTRIR